MFVLSSFLNKKRLTGIVARLLEAITMLLLVVLIPKLMSVSEYVEFQLYWPAGMLIALLLVGWLSGSLFRFIHSHLDSETEKHSLSAVVQILIFVWIVFLMLAWFLQAWWPLILCVAISQGLKDLLVKVLTAVEIYTQYLVLVSLFSVIRIGLLCLLYRSGINVFTLVVLFTFADMLVFFVVGKDIYFLVPSFKNTRNFLFKHAKYGFPLILAGLCNWVLSLSDRYILNYFAGENEVAGYILGYQLTSNMMLIPMSIMMSIYYPMILSLEKNHGIKYALEKNNFSLKYYYWIMVFIFAFSLTIVSWVTDTFYSGYQISMPVVTLIGLGCYLFGASHFYNKPIELIGETSFLAKSLFIAALINMVLNFMLIPYFYALGAAAATVISYSIMIIIIRYKSIRICEGLS